MWLEHPVSDDPRQVPRFIPTLTEVVEPASLRVTGISATEAQRQAMVDQLRRLLQPVLERRLQEECDQLVRQLVTQPWEGIRRQLRQELEDAVQQAVADRLSGAPPGAESSSES